MLSCAPRGGFREGAGRPAKPADEKYKAHNIKFTDSEWKEIQQLAKENNLSASEYIRRKVLES